MIADVNLVSRQSFASLATCSRPQFKAPCDNPSLGSTRSTVASISVRGCRFQRLLFLPRSAGLSILPQVVQLDLLQGSSLSCLTFRSDHLMMQERYRHLRDMPLFADLRLH